MTEEEEVRSYHGMKVVRMSGVDAGSPEGDRVAFWAALRDPPPWQRVILEQIMAPRWIDRQAAKADPVVREARELTRARVERELLERVHSRTYSETSETAVEVHRAASPKRRLPKAAPLPPLPSVEDELARLVAVVESVDGAPFPWYSRIRTELVEAGLIKAFRDKDGTWTGDRITDAGRKRLASATS